jgi:hypothetical protein
MCNPYARSGLRRMRLNPNGLRVVVLRQELCCVISSGSLYQVRRETPAIPLAVPISISASIGRTCSRRSSDGARVSVPLPASAGSSAPVA